MFRFVWANWITIGLGYGVRWPLGDFFGLRRWYLRGIARLQFQSVLLELGSVCGIGLQRFHRISFLFSRRAEPVAEAIVPPAV
ncbi:hypothetical protein D8666_18405 [Ochrobactrum soli]|nr:hypothetical protein D8666_18405 [[Ochrobactrum] soli]